MVHYGTQHKKSCLLTESMHTLIHSPMFVHTHYTTPHCTTCTHASMHLCTHTHTHTHLCVHAHTHTHTHTHTHMHVYTHAHTHACTHTCMYTHTHMHVYTHARTHACIHTPRQSSLSYFPLFSSPTHPHCTQLDPRSCLTFQGGIWHQWKLGLLCYYLCLQILKHFMAVSIACCGKARIFDCMNVGVFISPVSSFLKPVIHFRDSVL